MKYGSALNRAARRVVRDQIDAGIRSAEPIAMQRAKVAVVRAAMHYYRWLGKPPSLPVFDYTRPSDRLIAACAALAKAKKVRR